MRFPRRPHEAHAIGKVHVLRHLVHASEVLVHVRLGLRVVDLLANGGEQLAEALDLVL